jgi:hypothetical protein
MIEEVRKRQREKDKQEEDFLRSLGVNEANAHECTIYRSAWDDKIIAVMRGDEFLVGDD